MKKRWKLPKSIDNQEITTLAETLKIDPSLATVLVNRGINSFSKAKSFFRPDSEASHDPFLMKDMKKASTRIKNALEEKESILVFGDYDVDGTCSVAMMYSFLKEYHKNTYYYIPDRYREGYGLSALGIDFAEENNCSLVICLDCGIKAFDVIAYAKSKSIDIIVCDHHLPEAKLPDAYAILDPKRNDCDYPFKELCGCGVGFKLIQALVRLLNLHEDGITPLLNYVALATCADIVPITGENRLIVHKGLTEINERPIPAFQALLNVAQVKKEIDVVDLVFVLGPRINAAGRIHSGNDAVELLISNGENDTLAMAKQIDQYNRERKNLDKEITQEALDMIGLNANDEKRTTVVFKEDWHKGVIGIVASRLIENYYRPTIVLTQSAGKITGSARSVKNFDVHEAISTCADLLESYGGHKYAAGLTMPIENLEIFKERFEEAVSSTITKEMLTPELRVDAELPLERINRKFYSVLRQMSPFGPGNMRPLFVTHNCMDTGWSKNLKDEHLKLYLYQIGNPEIKFGGIAFWRGDLLELVKSKTPFSVVYNLDINEWNGQSKIELSIKDIKPTAEVFASSREEINLDQI